MAIIGFRQDPTMPPGAGFFRGSDGKEKYAYAPDVAAKLAKATVNPMADLGLGAPAAPQMAMPGPVDLLAVNAERPAPDGPPQSRLDAGGGLGMAAPPPAAPQARATAQALPPPTPGATMPQPPAPEASGLTPQERAVGEMIHAAAKVPSAPARPAGWSPKSQSTTIEQGAPYSEEQANDRARVEANVIHANLATSDAYAKQQETAAINAGIERQIAQDDALKKQAEVQSKQLAYEENRAKVHQLVEATTNQQIDPGRWFKGENVFGGVMAVIGQAFTNFASIKAGHGPTNQMLDSIIDRDVAAQRMAIEQGRVKSASALAGLHEQFGDLDKATEALKMIQKQAATSEIARQGALWNSQQSRLKSQEWVAQREADFVKNEQNLYNLSVGKTTTRTDQAYQPASGGGAATPMARLKAYREAVKTAVDAGLPPEMVTKAVWGVSKPEKGQEALVVPDGQGGTIQARTEPEARELRKHHSLVTSAIDAADTMAEIAKGDTAGSTLLSPESKRRYAISREILMNSVNTLSGQGVVRTDDVNRWKEALSGDAWSLGAEKAAQEIKSRVQLMYRAQVDSQLSPGAKTTTITPGSAKEYGKK